MPEVLPPGTWPRIHLSSKVGKSAPMGLSLPSKSRGVDAGSWDLQEAGPRRSPASCRFPSQGCPSPRSRRRLPGPAAPLTCSLTQPPRPGGAAAAAPPTANAPPCSRVERRHYACALEPSRESRPPQNHAPTPAGTGLPVSCALLCSSGHGAALLDGGGCRREDVCLKRLVVGAGFPVSAVGPHLILEKRSRGRCKM